MTDVVAMPPVISMSSDEIDDDVAFQILNQDNLPINLINDAIVKPFGRDNQKQKPNGIVYPTRRIDLITNLEETKHKSFTKSNGAINQNQEKNNLNLRKNYSASYGNLCHTNSAATTKIKIPDQIDTKFTKTLDAKLRKLQKEERQQQQQQYNKRIEKDVGKKPFVTTVRKGEFLEPPPEIASLIGIKVDDSRKDEKKLYAYASQPRVLNRVIVKNVHKAKCEAAAKAAASIIGSVTGMKTDENGDVDSNINDNKAQPPASCANLMYDRRIHRGSNFSSNSSHLGDGESAAARAAEARRRALARRRAKSRQVKAAELRIRSPPPVPGRKHEPVQTDLYLEEIWEHPPVENICTQTELFLERPVSPLYIPVKSGIDTETQIYPGELFDFDMEVEPILEVLVGKTIEQALIEVLEEEELATLREQQRKFLEIRAAEMAEVQRLEEREKRLNREKERRLSDHEEGLAKQKELEERISAAVLMQGYIAELLPSVLEGLEAEGFLTDSIKGEVDDSFMPWLMKEVTNELNEMVSSRDVLTDIVKEILENREEIYRALNATPRVIEESDEEHPTEEGLALQNDEIEQ